VDVKKLNQEDKEVIENKMTKKNQIAEKDRQFAKRVNKYLDKNLDSGMAGYNPEIEKENNKIVYYFKTASSTDWSLAVHLLKKFKLKPYKRSGWEKWISFTK